MNENSEILRKHIESLSDEELEAVVTVDREQYREDAIAFAEAELRRRGLGAEPEEDESDAEAPNSFWGEAAPESVEEGSDEEDSDDAAAHASDGMRGGWGEGEFWGKGAQSPVAFKVFRGTFISWEELFQQAAEFASEIGPERVISISHSADKGDGVVTVWYRP